MNGGTPGCIGSQPGWLTRHDASPPWRDVYDDRDYSCVATRDFVPQLATALQRAHASVLGLEGTQKGFIPAEHDRCPLAGLDLLSRRSGVDKKVIKRIASHQVLVVSLRTADAILTACGMQIEHDLVIPAGRRAARRMAEDEAAARGMVGAEVFIRWRTGCLYARRLRRINNPPAPFVSFRERRNASIRRARVNRLLAVRELQATG